MPTAPFTESELAAILSEPMRIDEPVRWSSKSSSVWAEATLRVRHPQRTVNLTVKITANLYAMEKLSISLLLDGVHRIRAVDVNGSHANRHTDTNSWKHETHEHCWTDACHGAWACAVAEFPSGWQPAFEMFCRSLGIAFAGTWSDPLPAQLGLEDT